MRSVPKSPRPLSIEPSAPARAKPALAAVGVRPSKSRGQNFLVQAAIANRIVDAAALAPGDHVLEIGPGLGILSERIAAHQIALLTMVEIDPRLVERLQERFAGDRRARIVLGDFLEADLAGVFDHGPLKVVGNLPFNAAAAILRRLCGDSRTIDLMVLMFQREVGERIRARPGESAYSALSVFAQLYFEIEAHFRVGAGNFHPRPKVDAEVLVMRPYRTPRFSAADEALVLRTVRAAFSAPRKTLRNALGHTLGIGAAKIEAAVRRAAIDPGVRAETLSVTDLLRLAHELGADLKVADA
ncbi:MAG: 16S rRNA (adenine(1518)-N(6)/adenine(1519)-N(6))-dimethyltransferase RsmA [Candidatus Binataceae bacterium]